MYKSFNVRIINVFILVHDYFLFIILEACIVQLTQNICLYYNLIYFLLFNKKIQKIHF
jgi:hypothetical protein